MYALTRTCASLRTKMRAFFFKCSKITTWTKESMFQVILSISTFSARTRPRARHARTQHVRKINVSFFCMDLNSGTFFSRFTNFQSFSTWYEFMRARLNKKLRARVNSEKGQKHTLFQTAIALQNARLPPFYFKYFDRVWVVDHIS